MSITTEILTITPEMAHKFLSENNKSNRKVKQGVVDMLARSMLSGDFKLTHQGIAFYDDGDICDGQHRLHAIRQSKTSQRMLVTKGIPKDDGHILAIDNSTPRSVTDSSVLSGIKIEPRDSQLVKALRFGVRGTHSKLSHKEIYELYQNYSSEIEIAKQCFPKHKSPFTTTAIKIAVIDSVADGISIDVVKRFAKILVSGFYNYDYEKTCVVLRDKLLQLSSTKKDAIIAMNLAKRAIKAMADKQELKFIRLPNSKQLVGYVKQSYPDILSKNQRSY